PARGVVDGELSAEGVYEAAGDGKAEADTGTGVPVAQALERLENLFALVSGYAGHPVDHPQLDGAAEGARLDAYRPVRWRPSDGVVDHIGHSPLEQRGVDVD